jgi:zinc protease
MTTLRSLLAFAVLSVAAAAPALALQPLAITRATLANGLQVVVVRDPLAPVVMTTLNYRVGSNEEQYPGEAHALEHMMFRGTPDVSQTQLFEISQLMGGDYDADTQPEITQFFFEVPAQYLDVAIRLEADRARHLLLSQPGWQAESGAIKQEVTQDDSNPIEKLFERTILPSIFADTPYAKDTLGTLYSFNNQIDANVLRRFYSTWYHPNNAVYVIAGDVDGPATIRLVRRYFGDIPAAKLPKRAKVVLRPLKAASYRVESDQPYTLVAMSFRLPGWNDRDYAASQILEAVLNDQRSDLYGLVASGKSLYTGFQEIQAHPSATAGALLSAVPVTTNPQSAAADLRTVLEAYRKNGLPPDLVLVEKQRAIADDEFDANSIDGLANAWNDAVAVMGQRSPGVLLDAMERVSVADVNRVFREYFDPDKAIVAYAVPKNPAAAAQAAAGPAKENNTLTPETPQPLPPWAQQAFARIAAPAQVVHPVPMTLANGMQLIVIPESVTPTVEVYGSIVSNEAIQAPPDKLGVADVVAGLFSFGTTQYDRIALRQQLDSIAADVDAGTDFDLHVSSSHFDRGVQLLAGEELHPAFPAAAFQIVKQQEIGTLAGLVRSPDHLADVALNKALYPAADPLQRFATPQTASAIELADVRSYYARAYRPDMTQVVVIGDVTPAQARATFEKYFGSWSAIGPKPDITLPQVPKNAASSFDVPDAARVQSTVELSQVFDLPRADPDWAQLQVANNILGGGGFGSVLMDDLRVRHGYVYTAHSALDSYKERSVFSIDYACDPDKIVPAQQLAISDLRALESRGVSSERLQRAKAMLMSDTLLRAAAFGGIAQQLLSYVGAGLPLDEGQIDAQRELDATPSSIQSAMAKWISPDDFVRIVTGPGPT